MNKKYYKNLLDNYDTILKNKLDKLLKNKIIIYKYKNNDKYEYYLHNVKLF